MAVEQEFDNNNNAAPGSQPVQNNEQLSTGVQSAPTAPASAPTSPNQARAPQGSGRFSNLRRYIDANKQYNEAGGGISGKIQEQSQKRLSGIREGIESQKTQAQNQYNQLQGAINQQGQQLQTQAFQDPRAFLQNQQNVQEFQKLRTGGYAQDVNQLGSNANQFVPNIEQLQGQAQAAGTEAGRFSLLRDRFSQPNYTTGQQRLDQLLLQATPGSARSLRTGLESLAQQGQQLQSGLESDITGKRSELGNIVTQRQEAINNLLRQGVDASGIESDLTGRGYEDINLDVQNRFNQLQQNLPTEYQNILAAAQANANTQGVDLSQLTGLESGTNLYNLDLANYLPNLETVQGRLAQATPEQLLQQQEFDRLEALSQLAGIQGPNIQADQIGQFTPYEFDRQRFLADQGTRKRDYENYLNQIKESLPSLTSLDQLRASLYNPASNITLDAQRQFLENPTNENLQKYLDAQQRSLFGRGQLDTKIERDALNAWNLLQNYVDPYRSLNTGRTLIGNNNISNASTDEDLVNSLGS